VACGTLSLEVNARRASGFLAGCQITFTTPGLHEAPVELEVQRVLTHSKIPVLVVR
jgi:hypothetical protein